MVLEEREGERELHIYLIKRYSLLQMLELLISSLASTWPSVVPPSYLSFDFVPDDDDELLPLIAGARFKLAARFRPARRQ